ncbi:hypothetical protein P9222_06945 [Paenibacillus amylolyticus]|nr:hypothetical protein [Paenibacillus amylolyticus]WFR63956.1 hypothetical protein P9222_06945 [Paenibacillus amylolyticus]
MNLTMTERLKEMQQEEKDLVFGTFDSQTALNLGLHLVEEAKRRSQAVTIDITLKGHRLFCMPWKALIPTTKTGFDARTMW